MESQKEQIITKIAFDLMRKGFDSDQINVIKQSIYLAAAKYDFVPQETGLACVDPLEQNCVMMFYIAKKVEGCSDKTLYYYNREITKFMDTVQKQVRDITSDDIRIYIAKLGIERGVSKVTQNNVLRILRSFFTWLAEEEHIDKNPAQKIKEIKTIKKQKKAFTSYDIEKIRSGAVGLREKALIEVLLSTGCRVSEIVQIDYDKIRNGKTVIMGKGAKERTVFFNAKAQFAIDEYIKSRSDDNPALFVSDDKRAQRCGKGWVEATVRNIGQTVGVENVHPHRFRRTAATMAMNRGMPVEQIQKMLGHSTIATTQIYLDMSSTDLEDNHKKYLE